MNEGDAMTNERISQLERSVKRWRLVSLLLAFLLILVLAAGGIFTAIPATRDPGDFWLWLPWVRARAAREAEERARENAVRAERALDALEAERRAAKEREKQAIDTAAK